MIKNYIIAALVLSWISSLVWVYTNTKTTVIEEIKTEQLENYKDTRKRVDAATKNSAARDAASAREWLRLRAQRTNK